MAAIRTWFIGRKTYLLAGALFVLAVILIAMGRLTAHTALILLLMASVGFPVTFKAALDRHHDEELQLLEESAGALTALAAHNLPMAVAVGEQAVQDGIKLAEQCKAEGAGA